MPNLKKEEKGNLNFCSIFIAKNVKKIPYINITIFHTES